MKNPVKTLLSSLMLGVLVAGTARASDSEQTSPLVDFEAPYQPNKYPEDSAGKVVLSPEWKSDGQTSLKLDPELMTTVEQMKLHDWSGYNVLRIHFKNPTDQTTAVGFELADTIGHGYLDRHQNGFGVPPGEKIIEVDFAGGLWRGEDNHPYRGDTKTPIDIAHIARFAFYNHGKGPIYIDQVELVKVKKLETPGGFAFDFAKSSAQIMSQFIAITEKTAYDASHGYGLTNGAQAGSTPMAYPTPMLGSGLHWEGGFRVDLPAAGPYIGLVAFERGGFWETEGAGYSHATLKDNGISVHEHDFSTAGMFFLFQDTDITDLAQVSDKIIWPAHAISTFKFAGAKGDNTFTLETRDTVGLPLRVAGLIIAPDTAAGKAYLDAHVTLQREAIANAFTPQDRGRRTDGRSEPTKDLVCESLSPGEDLYPRDWPHTSPKVSADVLAVAGQTVAVQLGLYAKKELAAAVSAKELAGPGKLPTAPVISHGRYMPMRPYGVGAIWLEINHYHPEPKFSVGPNVSRSLVVEYEIPSDAKPGDYSGSITIAGASAPIDVPVKIHVIAAKLADIPIPLGLFENAISFDQHAVDEATWWKLQESMVKEQVSAGLSALTGGPGLGMSFTPDGASISGDAAVRYIKIAQKYGPIRAIIPYGGFLDRPAPGTEAKAAETLKAFEEKNQLPPCFLNCYDEPGTVPEKTRVLSYLKPLTAAGFRTLGWTSANWEDSMWVDIIANSYGPAFNLHDASMFAKVKAMGKHPWIYNNLRGRYGYGIDLWRQIKLGCEGRVDWIGNYTQGFAFSNLDGREPSSAFFAVHRDLGVLKTPGWLALKAGMLDLRLRLALEQVAPADDPALQLWKADGYRTDESTWTSAEMDRVRAAMLKRLQELAKK
ncbi:MAG: hypothetical protein H0W83_06370 [Planctomycetes bacterium]|nr:hypothetical protein [Planctomycetota bacterium]